MYKLVVALEMNKMNEHTPAPRSETRTATDPGAGSRSAAGSI